MELGGHMSGEIVKSTMIVLLRKQDSITLVQN